MRAPISCQSKNCRRRDMHGALNLENLHYFNGMQLNTQSPAAFKMQEIPLETKTPLMFMLFLRCLTMFLGPLIPVDKLTIFSTSTDLKINAVACHNRNFPGVASPCPDPQFSPCVGEFLAPLLQYYCTSSLNQYCNLTRKNIAHVYTLVSDKGLSLKTLDLFYEYFSSTPEPFNIFDLYFYTAYPEHFFCSCLCCYMYTILYLQKNDMRKPDN